MGYSKKSWQTNCVYYFTFEKKENRKGEKMKNKMTKLVMTSIVTLLVADNSFAYPIVSDSESIRQGDILTLYPDHRDPNKVYFFPNSSMLAVDNSELPMFGLTTWGLNEIPFKSENAGAYMTFTARLTSDPLQQKAIDSYLADNPTKRIAVIPVKESTVGLTTNASNSNPFGKLIEEMSLSEHGGHGEDEIGFMATLTGIGARVFREAVKKPDVFKINYCYSFDGAGPDMDAKITVNWQRVYDHYRASFSVGSWFRKATITREVEKLRQDGHVKWEINGGTDEDQEYVKTITEEIVKRLFVPELQYVPAHQAAPRGWSFLNFGFTSTHRSEFKTETWEISRRALVERERCLPVNVRNVKNYYDTLVSDI